VKTRLRPFTGLGLAQLVSTLAVCGVAALIAPSASVAADTMDVPAIAAAPDRTQPGNGWMAESIVTDPADSDDGDDGGDDAPAASGVVPSSHRIDRTFDHSWLIGHPVFVSRASLVLAGHALRGPPSADDDVFNVDDDDDSPVPTSRPIPASRSRALQIFRSQSNQARYRTSDVPSMRAP
jgi:hypothetical protein